MSDISQRSHQEVASPPRERDRLARAALAAAKRHSHWLERYGSLSWDQYDFWANAAGRRAKAVYYRRPKLGSFLVAPFVLFDWLVPRSRSLVWRRQRFPIADAHYAMGFCYLARLEGQSWLVRAVPFLDALVAQRCPDEDEYCWGYPFDWETCFGTWKAGTPLITSTPYGYEAFEAAHGLTGSDAYAAIMESVGRFAWKRIPSWPTDERAKASAYSPYDTRRVVNASAYRGALLATAGRAFGHSDWLDEARAAAAFVVSSQQADGSWLYAMDGRDAFIDNFHTCFVLKNLIKTARALDDEDLLEPIAKGYRFYKESLLDGNGLPVPFAKTQRLSLVRRELYDYAEGINLAVLMSDLDADAPQILERLVSDLLDRWILPDGHFITREAVLRRNTVPYHRWAQSQTFRALALVAVHGAV